MTIALSSFSAGKSLPLRRSPMFGEPAHGWLVAHVAQNKGYSVRQYAESLGFNGRALHPPELLYWMKSLDLRDFDLAEAATPIFQGNDVIIMGQSMRRKQWSIDRRRFCPACLAESPHHRTWWDIAPFRHCPFHGLDLVSSDDDGCEVPWWWPSFETSPNLKPIHRYGVPTTGGLPMILETYILMRLGVVEKDRDFPVLDRFPTLGEVFKLIERLGSILGWEPESALTEREIFEHLVDGHQGVFRAIDRLARVLLDGKDVNRGVQGLFGNRYRSIAINLVEGSPLEYIIGVMKEVANHHGFGSWTARRNKSLPGRIGLADVAAQLGIQPETVRLLLVRFGIREQSLLDQEGYFSGVTQREADRLLAVYATLKTADEGAAQLGTERKFFDGLVRIGEIAATTRRKNVPRFLTSDIEAFARKLEQVPLVGRVPKGCRRLGDLKVAKHGPIDRYLRIALDGERPVFGRVGPSVTDLLVEGR